MLYLISFALLGAIANVLRGTVGVLVVVPAALLAAMVLCAGGEYWMAGLAAAAFIFGENWGWTRWIWGARGVYDKGLDTGVSNGSLWITKLFANEDNKPWFHQFGMFVRGLYWFVPVYLALWFSGLVAPVPAVGATVLSSIMFYITYRIGWHISQKKGTRYLKTSEAIFGSVYFGILAAVTLL